MLLDGEIDAAVVGDKLPDPRLKHLIADHDAAAQRWAQQHGGIPINHMVVVRSELSRSRPDVVKEFFRLLVESKNAAGPPKNPEPLRFGVEANRPSLAMIAEYAFQQRLLPHRVSVDDMFAETLGLVGDEH